MLGYMDLMITGIYFDVIYLIPSHVAPLPGFSNYFPAVRFENISLSDLNSVSSLHACKYCHM
jgi:hypothetical protein